MRVRFVRPEDTYGLRLQVLRPGGVIEDCQWPQDRAEGSFHLAAQIGEHRVSIASFQVEKHPSLKGWKQYRLRGMATHPDLRGQGAGRRIVLFALDHLKAQHADLLWCHAREEAIPFYRALGFEGVGERFEIPGIGPHLTMWRKV